VTERTIPALIRDNAQQFGNLPALSWPIAGGRESLDWRQTRQLIAHVACGLADLGVRRGERVALMMGNRTEHWLADLAAVHLGATPCTVYATMPPSQISYVARHSRAAIAILEGDDQLRRWLPILGELPDLRHIVVVDPSAIPTSPADLRFVAWSDVVATGRSAFETDPQPFEAGWRSASADDPLTLVYTSGTTGKPKGVLLTHRNVLANADGLDAAAQVPDHFRNVCYLPLAHIAERMVSIYLPIHKAGHVNFCADQGRLLAELAEVRPTLFFGVPRVWEKIAAGLRAAFGDLTDGGATPASPAAMLAAVGLDQVTWACSAGAPLASDVQRYFGALGLTILESWGMTETTGVATTTGVDQFRFGSVGTATAGNEIKLLADGEVLVRGPIVCAGYLQQDGTVVPAADSDGWMHTGDVGRLDDDGFLCIVDRKKDLIITSGGKNIAPALVENLLGKHPLIGQALVYGDRQPYLVALVVLDAEAARAWAAARGIDGGSLTELSEHPAIIAEISGAVDTANAELSRAEQVKRFRVLATEWTVEGGELTPSLKLMRSVVQDSHQHDIASLYGR
jgi:long-chain acyl-CoA synthetase